MKFSSTFFRLPVTDSNLRARHSGAECIGKGAGFCQQETKR